MKKIKPPLFFIIASSLLLLIFTNTFADGDIKRVEQKNSSTKVEKKDKIGKIPIKADHPSNHSKIRPFSKEEARLKYRSEQKAIGNHNEKIKHKIKKKISKKYHTYQHRPYKKNVIHKTHYSSPLKYHYTIHPRYLYRGLWIRINIDHADGYYFYNDYPYFIYNGYLHRYSSWDRGSYDLVDRKTDEVYATFYGNSLKQSYDRCAELRDKLNNKLGEYRYFCAERFVYDPDYSYGWEPQDYPNWYWH